MLASVCIASIQKAVKKALTRLPTCFGQLTALTTLSLSYLEIEELLASIESLTALETLSLVFLPELTQLPASIGSLAQLTAIKMWSLSGLTRLSLCFG